MISSVDVPARTGIIEVVPDEEQTLVPIAPCGNGFAPLLRRDPLPASPAAGEEPINRWGCTPIITHPLNSPLPLAKRQGEGWGGVRLFQIINHPIKVSGTFSPSESVRHSHSVVVHEVLGIFGYLFS